MEVLHDGKQTVDERIAREGIRFYDDFMNPYFLVSDYIENIALHRKQKQIGELNQTNQISALFSPRNKYAVAEYNMWHF